MTLIEKKEIRVTVGQERVPLTEKDSLERILTESLALLTEEEPLESYQNTKKSYL